MVRLYVVRHGIAADPAEWKEGGDELRPLIGKGRRRFRRVARALAERAGKLDLILTSPLVRAVQTAEILAGEVRHSEVDVLAALASGGGAALLRAVAARAGDASAIALVGHEPQLSGLLALLNGLGAEQAARVDLRKGAIVRVDLGGLTHLGEVRPRWWLDPRTARRRPGLPLHEETPAPG